jgi:hypothetical protein
VVRLEPAVEVFAASPKGRVLDGAHKLNS